MSWRDSKHPVTAAVIASLIVFPLTLFIDVVRRWVVAFCVSAWGVFCAIGSGIRASSIWLANTLSTVVPLPLWALLLIAIGGVVCFRTARVYRQRALDAEGRPDKVERVEAKAQAPRAAYRSTISPDFRPNDAQRRIIELLARNYPSSQSLNDLHYATRYPTKAHTERDVEDLVDAGIVRFGQDYVHGTYFNLTQAGRDYAIDNRLFAGGR